MTYAQKRKQYANDEKALQEIDKYDGESLWHVQYNQLITAIKLNNKQLEKNLVRWFKKNYPDV